MHSSGLSEVPVSDRVRPGAGAGNEPVFVKPVGDGKAIAIGLPESLNAVGQTVETIPEVFLAALRRAAATAPEFQNAAQLLSGRVVKLTDASMKLLEKNQVVMKDGGMLGLVRGPDGRFSGVLSFTSLNDASHLFSSVTPGIAGAIGMQLALADIERKLNVLQADMNYLIEHQHLEVDAGIEATLTVLADVFAAVRRRGGVDDDEWDRAVSTELPIRELHALTTKHLRALREVLDDDERPLTLRVRRLNSALRAAHTGDWLQMHVHAELALSRWELLYVTRQADRHPDELADLVEQITVDLESRREELGHLAQEIADYLVRGDKLTGWLDRVRLVSRYRMAVLFQELDDVLNAFTDELIYVDFTQDESLPAGDGKWRLIMRNLPNIPTEARRAITKVGSAAGELVDRVRRS